MKPVCCKECRHLVVPPGPDGKRRVFKGKVYACGYDVGPRPPLPASIVKASWQPFRWPPSRTMVTVEMGTDCETFERRVL